MEKSFVTPERTKRRRLVEESPSELFRNPDSPEIGEISYDYLPNSTVKVERSNASKIPWDRRPYKFRKSPTYSQTRKFRPINQPKISQEELHKCFMEFKAILQKDNKESLNDKEINSPTRKENIDTQEEEVEDKEYTNFFDDSNNEMMLVCSQAVEDVDTLCIDDNNIENITEVQKSPGLHTVNKTKRETNPHFLLRNEAHKLSNCKNFKQKSAANEVPEIKNQELTKECREFKTGFKLEMKVKNNSEQNKKTPLNPIKDSNLSQLLEDGNDAGFFDLDETMFNEIKKNPLSRTLKCTPQQIEEKRREALKKLQEKRLRFKRK